MGTVVQLKNQINDSYFQLKQSVEEKLILTEEKIKSKLASKIELVQKMSNYHIETGGKRLRALLTLNSAKLCGYKKGFRDVDVIGAKGKRKWLSGDSLEKFVYK